MIIKKCTCGHTLTTENSIYLGKSSFKNKIVLFYNCEYCRSTMCISQRSNKFKTLILLILSTLIMSCSKNIDLKENNNINTQPNVEQPSDQPSEQPKNTWVETPDEPNFGSSTDTDNPNVLILGDSISIGYTGNVIKNIGSKYDIRHPADNCRNSYFTLTNLDKWLSEYPNNSVITWNNGIWDSARKDWYDRYVDYAPESWYGVSFQDYENNIIQIARKLKSTGARVIFFTTTDIPLNSGVFDIGKEKALNEIAKRVLPAEGVEVYDLYSFSLTLTNAHTSPDSGDVHFTNAARQSMGDYVTKAIEGEL